MSKQLPYTIYQKHEYTYTRVRAHIVNILPSLSRYISYDWVVRSIVTECPILSAASKLLLGNQYIYIKVLSHKKRNEKENSLEIDKNYNE